MARQRTTFGKIMREREKQQRAQEKQERRAERSSDDGVEDEETVEVTEPAHDEGDVLASLERLHKAFDDEQIDFDTFEERRAELMSRLKID